MSQLFASGGQCFGVSASTSVLPMNTQDWSPLGWTGWISLQSKGLSSLLQHHSSKASILWCSAFFTIQLLHPYMITGKTTALTRWTFVGKVMSLLLNMLSKLVITFLPRSKRLLISWLQLPSTVILEPKTTMCKIDSWWESVVWHRELKLVLCENLEKWMGWEGGGRLEKRGYLYIVMTYLSCCMAETNTKKQLSSN